MKNIKWYGWIKDHPDPRDFPYMVRKPVTLLPSSMLPDAVLPPVLDQSDLGSCTAFGITEADMTTLAVKFPGQKGDSLAQLFLYYLERVSEGTVDSDSGAQIRDGIKCMAKQGCCRSDLWPYDIEKFADKPTQAAYADALVHKAHVYHRIKDGDLQGMKSCIAEGFPFVFGFMVYEQFESAQAAKDGIIKMPTHHEILSGALGGHAVMATGYNDAKPMPDGPGAIRVRNSWGDWGDHGDFWLPYGYFQGDLLASDFWTFR